MDPATAYNRREKRVAFGIDAASAFKKRRFLEKP
jgi:hypothetical protein